jgi:hypothetical protein
LKGSATLLSWRSTRPVRGRPRGAGGCRPATRTLLPARRIVHKNPTLLRDDANHLLHVDEKEAVAKESGAQLEQLRLIRFRSVADSRDPPEPPRRRLGEEAFAAAEPVVATEACPAGIAGFACRGGHAISLPLGPVRRPETPDPSRAAPPETRSEAPTVGSLACARALSRRTAAKGSSVRTSLLSQGPRGQPRIDSG